MTGLTSLARGLPSRSWILAVLPAILATGLGGPGSLSAQAICSAPHSSPTLAQSGSLQTLPQLGGWIQASVFGSRSTEFFGADGNRQSFLGDSEFLTRSMFLSGAVGVVDGVELWTQIPLHHLRVESAGGDSESFGLGDIRIAARVGSELFGWDVPLALRVGTKVPGSDFPVDATVLPLTEGQRDWELSVESAYRSRLRALYIMGWAGYRWREANERAARDPGDELFGHLAVGGSLGNLSLELAADALWGKAPVAQGFILEGNGRRLIQIQPTVGWGVGPGRLEATAQIPVWGKHLPVGNGISLGYRLTWGLEPDEPESLLDILGEEKR